MTVAGTKSVTGGKESHADSSTGAVAFSVSPKAGTLPFTLRSVRVTLSSNGSTSEEATITINSGRGSTYDSIIDRQDMQNEGVFFVTFTGVELEPGDTVDIAYPNTDASTVTTVVVLGGV